MTNHRLHRFESGSLRQYVKDLVERAVASFAGGALSVLGVGAIDVINVNWQAVLGIGGGAALVSILKGLAAKNVGDRNAASAVPTVVTKPIEEIEEEGQHRGV